MVLTADPHAAMRWSEAIRPLTAVASGSRSSFAPATRLPREEGALNQSTRSRPGPAQAPKGPKGKRLSDGSSNRQHSDDEDEDDVMVTAEKTKITFSDTSTT